VSGCEPDASGSPINRRAAPILQDREQARLLGDHEPAAHPVLTAMLDGDTLPRSGQALVLGARLGGLARALATAHPSWQVIALDPSVALLSASLDAIRPAGLSSQLTVMQSHLPSLPIDSRSVDRILGDLPLAHLYDQQALEQWGNSVAQALAPRGLLHLRVARPDLDEDTLNRVLASVPAPWAELLRPVWHAAFPLSRVLEALSTAGLKATVRTHPGEWARISHLIDAHR